MRFEIQSKQLEKGDYINRTHTGLLSTVQRNIENVNKVVDVNDNLLWEII